MEKTIKKNTKKKSSLAHKLLFSMLLVVIISTVASFAMNRILLGPYYYYQQSRILNNTANQVDELYTGVLNEDIVRELNTMGYGINGMILIYNQDNEVLYSSRAFQGQFFSVTEDELGAGKKNLLLDGTRIGFRAPSQNKAPVSPWKDPLITVEKELKNGDHLIIQTSETALEASVGIINQFTLYPASVALIAAIVLAFFLTKKITRPVVELTEITKRMKSLDFSSRYEGEADDEIGELGQNFNDLAETLGITIGELNQANDQLREDIEREKAIEEARKNFISNVSHELKTPISLIRGYAEGIRDQVIEPQDFEEYLSVIIEESEHMSSMVRELLTLSKLESHHIPTYFEEVDVTEIINRVIEMFSFEMHKEGIKMVYEAPSEPKMLVCDQNMLETMLTNFMSNALDHVEGEKIIEIRLEETLESLGIHVRNSGKTIVKEDQDKIWDSFYKIDKARTRAYGGTGLGLAIVKNMVEIHKGTYGVENWEDGVDFYIRLPKDNKVSEK
ncbi:HAMP domain-containing protein [Clostridia bacterium]|nr:HAMP domain-containing protein [Clostridia bacterium]